MKKYKSTFIIAALLFTLLIQISEVYADKVKAGEYEIKTAYLYYFAKFIEWPAEELSNSSNKVYLCVLGEKSFDGALGTINNKKIKGRKLSVKRIDSIVNIDNCNILFISNSQQEPVSTIFQALGNRSVLTVGEMKDFAVKGGMVNFVVKNNKVRFQINMDRIQNARLKISSELLGLAEIIRK